MSQLVKEVYMYVYMSQSVKEASKEGELIVGDALG